MSESKPAQLFHWHDPGNGRRYQGEHFALAAVKEQRFIATNEEMIVGESSGRCRIRCENREAVHSRSYLVDPGFHAISFHGSPAAMQRCLQVIALLYTFNDPKIADSAITKCVQGFCV